MPERTKIDMTCPVCEDVNIEVDGSLGECLSCNSDFAIGQLVATQNIDGTTIAIIHLASNDPEPKVNMNIEVVTENPDVEG